MSYVMLRQGGLTATAGTGRQAAPGSGATITLFDSNANNPGAQRGSRWRRLISRIKSSHISAVDGLKFQESYDGTSWDTLIAYTVPATTAAVPYSVYSVAVAAPNVRVTYENSANVLTTWQMTLEGDTEERSE